MKSIIFISIFIILLSACGNQLDESNVGEKEVENLILLLTEFRHNVESYNYEEVDKLFGEINHLLKDNAFSRDRVVLEGYLSALYSVIDKGIAPYQQFLKELPKNYDGILSELLWEDYNKLYSK